MAKLIFMEDTEKAKDKKSLKIHDRIVEARARNRHLCQASEKQSTS